MYNRDVERFVSGASKPWRYAKSETAGDGESASVCKKLTDAAIAEINVCLNCTREKCSGTWPACQPRTDRARGGWHKNRRPMPEDFVSFMMTGATHKEMIARYRAGSQTVRRWIAEWEAEERKKSR